MKIRIAAEQDAQAILEIYAPYVKNTAITFEYEVPTVAEFTDRMCQIQKKFPYLVAEDQGEILGYAYASAFHERAAYNWAVETSVYVKKACRGRGIGRKLYDILECILREQGILNLNACIAYPEVEDEYLNRNSVMFHEKLGFQPVGKFHKCGYKFNRWYHMVWMEKHIGLHVENQPEVKAFHEMKDRISKRYGIA